MSDPRSAGSAERLPKPAERVADPEPLAEERQEEVQLRPLSLAEFVGQPALKEQLAIFLEAAFPESHAWLAKIAKHLTPSDFVREMQKVTCATTFYAVHIKPLFRDRIIQELLAHRLPNLEIARFGTEYEFV